MLTRAIAQSFNIILGIRPSSTFAMQRHALSWLKPSSASNRGCDRDRRQWKLQSESASSKSHPVHAGSGINRIFRFILTHPDMDHMDGIKALFEALSPYNFWDTENEEEKQFDESFGRYDEDDWLFYKELRDNKSEGSPKA